MFRERGNHAEGQGAQQSQRRQQVSRRGRRGGGSSVAPSRRTCGPRQFRSAKRYRHKEVQGFQLLELLVVLAVAGIVVSFGAPALLRASRRLRVRMAADEVASASRRQESTPHGTAPTSRSDSRRSGARRSRSTPREMGMASATGHRTGIGSEGRNLPAVLPTWDPTSILDFRRMSAPTDPSNPYARLGRLEDPVRFNRSISPPSTGAEPQRQDPSTSRTGPISSSSAYSTARVASESWNTTAADRRWH